MPDVSFETDKSVKVGDFIDVDVEDKELCPSRIYSFSLSATIFSPFLALLGIIFPPSI